MRMTRAEKTERNLIVFGSVKPTLADRLKALPALLKSILTKSSDNFIPATQYGWFGMGSTIQDASKINAINEGWNKNATLYSIVRKIAKTCACAPWQVYKVVDDQAYKRYKAMSMQEQTSKTFAQLHLAKVKALQPVQSHPLNDLYANPNPQNSGSEYTEALITYKLLTGDAYEWGRMVSRGTVAELWPLPSHLMQIISNGMFPVGVLKYALLAGTVVQFTPEEVLHTKYFNPNYSFLGNHLYGFSPLQAAWLNLQQDNDARDAAIEMLQNRGVRGIMTLPGITSDSVAAETAGRLKERWREMQIEDRGGIVAMPGDGKFVPVGLTMADLKILEISGYTQDDLCNVYNVWSGLFNSQGTQTHDNVNQYKKDFIVSVILPELNSLRDARNNKLQRDWGYKGKGIVLDYDATVFSELQEDMEKLATWLNTAWWFTPNKKLAYMNESPEDNPAMDRVYIPSTYVPIDEVGMTDVPAQGGLNDYAP